MNDITIVTEQLILRKFDESDVEKCYRNFGKDLELELLVPMLKMKSKEDMRILIEFFISLYAQKKLIWLIVEKQTNEPIGYIIVDFDDNNRDGGELSFFISSDYQDKNYAFEAIRSVIDYVFNVIDLCFIEAKYGEKNKTAAKLFSNLGFTRCGSCRDYTLDSTLNPSKDLLISVIKINKIYK